MPSDPNNMKEIVENGHTIAHFIRDYWPILLAAIGFVVSILVVLKGKIPLLERRVDDAFNKLQKLDDKDLIGRRHLFDSNNQV